jgi:hypothetical protein
MFKMVYCNFYCSPPRLLIVCWSCYGYCVFYCYISLIFHICLSFNTCYIFQTEEVEIHISSFNDAGQRPNVPSSVVVDAPHLHSGRRPS